MRISFVTSGKLNEFTGTGERNDLVCFPFQALGEVSFERELKGETSLFEDVAILSKELKCAVASGCYTNARGMKRKSVVVAERGRILGVCDMANIIDKCEFRAGAGTKIFEVGLGKMGVVVAEDLYFPQTVQTLSACGADFILCVFEELREGLEQTLIRASAFFYGVPVCLCSYGYAQIAEPTGKLCFSSPQSPCSFRLEQEQEYHVVETRKKMLLRQKTEF